MGEHKVTFISVHSGAGGIITDSGTVWLGYQNKKRTEIAPSSLLN